MEARMKSSRRILCSVCLDRCYPTYVTCDRCRAVYYCTEKCQNKDKCGPDTEITGHKYWCPKVISYKNDVEMLSFPFSFASDTTRSDFTKAKYKSFLKFYGVLGQGMWALEVLQSKTLGELGKAEDPFVLPSESSLLDDIVAAPTETLKSWADYYGWRGFHLSSPIAILMQWPLTIYYILTTRLPLDCFNAGLVAYTTWIETVKLLAELSIPTYFTEYCWKSYELTRIQIDRLLGRPSSSSSNPAVAVSEGLLNPFRSPIRIEDHQTEIPAFSNAILFHLLRCPAE